MKTRLIGVALLLGLATACSSTSGSGADSAAEPMMNSGSSAEGGAAVDEPKSTGKPVASGEKDISQPGVDRKLVRTATIELTSGDVYKVVDEARGIAVTEGGYAGREEVRDTAATLTLHIPSDRFDAALDALSELGKVISRNQTAEDVTEQVVDLDSRIATQRASVDRVRALLARAGTVEEIVRIEQEVTTREADLESLEQRRQALAGQVAMSTVTISVNKATTAPEPKQQEEEATGFLAGLSDGWGAFLDAGGVILRVIGALLPFLVLLGVPAVAAFRWWRRRRPAVAAAPAPPA